MKICGTFGQFWTQTELDSNKGQQFLHEFEVKTENTGENSTFSTFQTFKKPELSPMKNSSGKNF
jgi:hypothetical protein